MLAGTEASPIDIHPLHGASQRLFTKVNDADNQILNL